MNYTEKKEILNNNDDHPNVISFTELIYSLLYFQILILFIAFCILYICNKAVRNLRQIDVKLPI